MIARIGVHISALGVLLLKIHCLAVKAVAVTKTLFLKFSFFGGIEQLQKWR